MTDPITYQQAKKERIETVYVADMYGGITRTTLDLVQWYEKEHCVSVAYWVQDDDGYTVRFARSRFLDVDEIALLRLLKIGQRFLDEHFLTIYSHDA